MSRIGKLPINIPENVDINYNDSEIKDTFDSNYEPDTEEED